MLHRRPPPGHGIRDAPWHAPEAAKPLRGDCSSLDCLYCFPIDKLKIDRSFIWNMHAAPQNQAVINAVIGLGHALGLQVRAEGVAPFIAQAYNTTNSTIRSTVMDAISANDLKTRGVGAIDQALEEQTEASVTVRGKVKYVVMSKEHYQYLRECELAAALAESQADLAAGRFVKETVDQHLQRIRTMNKNTK
jgi:PHD/YefM family antitoxin component YafN of YafNO toxin-antitoxin module